SISKVIITITNHPSTSANYHHDKHQTLRPPNPQPSPLDPLPRRTPRRPQARCSKPHSPSQRPIALGIPRPPFLLLAQGCRLLPLLRQHLGPRSAVVQVVVAQTVG